MVIRLDHLDNLLSQLMDFLAEANELLQKGIHLSGDKTCWSGLDERFRFRPKAR